jgi:uncharacterized protein (TIGR03067 family)
MKLTIAVFSLAAVVLIAADEPKKDNDEALKGNWMAVSLKQGDQSAPADDVKKLKFNFDGKAYTNLISDQVVEEGSYAVDASKTPKTIDFDIKKGQDKGKKQLAIYQIEGNKLTIIAALPGATERPKSLKPEPSEMLLQAVLEKVKP